ncbi:hypothetical protein NHX12_017765 [Muraenolepis orangiensis]|uniref:Protrudin n=1 Tax=Muraenolepis orangiensis TaxID=630683 RepID=A0A9Q0EVH1_9TELE|nr:hypothetical protein NHX12_017765 [Muraenolepis orangiensis]
MMHGAGVSQEPSLAAGERGELVHMSSKDIPGSPDPSEPGSPRSAPCFDLLKMVVSYKRMTLFLEPVTDAVELSRFLLGWRIPVCSLLVCVVLNFFFLMLSEVGWFLVCVMAVSTPAALGYLQARCGGSTSEEELQKKHCHAVHRRDLQMVHLTKQEAMLEVKDLLKFYGGVLFVTCLLYTIPVGWVLAGLINALFLWNRDFCRVLPSLRGLLHLGRDQACEQETERAEQEHGSLQDRTPTPTSLEDLSPGSVEEAEEAEPDDDFKDAIEEDDDGTLGTPDYDCITDNGLLSRNEPIRSKVSKLTEKLRKRYPTASTGNCSSCNAVFSVLKKRRSCSNCGNSFCTRCCSFKAQRETVFVCAPCNSSLIKFL